MWIPSHQSLRSHPKTGRFARALGITKPAAIGHLHCLWWWCLDFAPDGNLSPFEPEEIAEAAMWDGDPADLLAALIAAGFLDQDGATIGIHNWNTYAGRLDTQRIANAERQQRHRDRKRQPNADPDPADTRNGDVTVTPPLRNGPEKRREEDTRGHKNTHTGTAVPDGADAPDVRVPEDFDTPLEPRKPPRYSTSYSQFWTAYPSGRGNKKQTYEEWRRIRPDSLLIEEIMRGLAAWNASDRWRRGVVMNPKRWLRDRAWENPAPRSAAKGGADDTDWSGGYPGAVISRID